MPISISLLLRDCWFIPPSRKKDGLVREKVAIEFLLIRAFRRTHMIKNFEQVTLDAVQNNALRAIYKYANIGITLLSFIGKLLETSQT